MTFWPFGDPFPGLHAKKAKREETFKVPTFLPKSPGQLAKIAKGAAAQKVVQRHLVTQHALLRVVLPTSSDFLNVETRASSYYLCVCWGDLASLENVLSIA